MKQKLQILFSIIQFLLLSLLQTISVAQGTQGMIMNEIDGGVYTLKNFGVDNRMQDYQVFKIGKIYQQDSTFILPIIIYSYDQSGKLTDSTHTSYKCKPEAKTMLTTIFLHSGKYSGSRVSITQTSVSQLYPDQLKSTTTSLEDASFDLKIEGGFAGFFGARGKVLLSERQAKPLTGTQFIITGKLVIKSYALGIKISTLQYTLTETLGLSKGIIFQKFAETDGNYFTMELKQ